MCKGIGKKSRLGCFLKGPAGILRGNKRGTAGEGRRREKTWTKAWARCQAGCDQRDATRQVKRHFFAMSFLSWGGKRIKVCPPGCWERGRGGCQKKNPEAKGRPGGSNQTRRKPDYRGLPNPGLGESERMRKSGGKLRKRWAIGDKKGKGNRRSVELTQTAKGGRDWPWTPEKTVIPLAKLASELQSVEKVKLERVGGGERSPSWRVAVDGDKP